MRSYDYANRIGVEEITWERFPALAARLTVALTRTTWTWCWASPALVIPSHRRGLCRPRELYPVRVSRRVNDRVQYAQPV